MCKSLFANRFLLYPGVAIHLFFTHWSKSWGSFSTRNCSGKESKYRRGMRMEKWIVMRIRTPFVIIMCQSQQWLDEKKIQLDRPAHASTNRQTHVKEVSNFMRDKLNIGLWDVEAQEEKERERVRKRVREQERTILLNNLRIKIEF